MITKSLIRLANHGLTKGGVDRPSRQVISGSDGKVKICEHWSEYIWLNCQRVGRSRGSDT